MRHELSDRAKAVLLVAVPLSWVFAVYNSVISSTNPGAAAAVALFFAVVHFWMVSLAFRGTRSRLRFGLLALILPIVLLTLGNILRVHRAFSRCAGSDRHLVPEVWMEGGAPGPNGWIGPGREYDLFASVPWRLDERGLLSGGRDGSRCGTAGEFVVDLTVHPESRWFGLYRALDQLRREGCHRVRLEAEGRSIAVVLPADSSIVVLPSPSTVLATVRGQTKIRCRLNGDEVEDLAALAQRVSSVASMSQEAVGVLTFGPRVPAGRVVEVLEVFLDAGIQNVDFLGVVASETENDD